VKQKAKYKQRPLERLYKQTAEEQLKTALERLHEANLYVESLRIQLARRDRSERESIEVINNLSVDCARYEVLRKQEVMILSKDGAQYLKEEALDAFCDAQPKSDAYWWGSGTTEHPNFIKQQMNIREHLLKALDK
jgi:hypothetical protein